MIDYPQEEIDKTKIVLRFSHEGIYFGEVYDMIHEARIDRWVKVVRLDVKGYQAVCLEVDKIWARNLFNWNKLWGLVDRASGHEPTMLISNTRTKYTAQYLDIPSSKIGIGSTAAEARDNLREIYGRN